MTEPLAWLPDGSPFSQRFNDRYNGDINRGLDQAREVFLQGCGLPDAWADQAQWRILETGFGLGLNFLTTWKAWREDVRRPRLLHFISCEAWPVSAEDLLRTAPDELKPLAEELSTQFWGLLPGVHRLSFDAGRVLLTLYIGDAQQMLRQQTPQADSVYLDGFSPTVNPDLWNAYLFKAVARCCHRGTRLASWTIASEVSADLAQCGFEVQQIPGVPPKRDNLQAVYNPRWEPRAGRDALPQAAVSKVSSCLVIGAGLAGAACAASLARRGWRVTVLDQAGPAAGASGLLAGIFSPHVSPDDSVLSRMSRAGVRTTLQTLSSMPRGEVWDETGVLEHRIDGTQGVPATWLEPGHAGADWGRPARTSEKLANMVQVSSIACWHQHAGWVRPPRLIAHLLDHDNICVISGAQVASLAQHAADAPWQALDAQGRILATADIAIITAGFGSQSLLNNGWHLQALRGQISWGLHADDAATTAWPKQPLNGNGNLVPHAPLNDGMGWVLGSTFERDITELPPSAPDRAAAHAANFAKLSDLAPTLAEQLKDSFSLAEQAELESAPQRHASTVKNWSAMRCASHDRLPIVGPVDLQQRPGLWVSTAMGSRGLTLSMLCAELLAARLHNEPLPLEAKLAQALSSERAPSPCAQ